MEEKTKSYKRTAETIETHLMIVSFALSHIFYLFLFYKMGIKEMVIFNAISVLFYSILSVVPMYRNVDIMILDLLCSIELFLHQILGIYFIGLGSGLQYIFWGMISPLLNYTSKKSFKTLTIIKSISAFLCFLVLTFLYGGNISPVYTDVDNTTILTCRIFSISITFFIVAFSSMKTYEKFQHKLREEYELYEKEINKKLAMQEDIIKMIANMIEARDENTGKHTERTSYYVKAILEKLKEKTGYKEKLSDDYVKNIISAATLHDIGKIKIPDAILNKPGKLTDEEYDIIKTHTTEGAKLIDMCENSFDDKEYLNIARQIILSHHERIDGKGYPNHLKDDEIPFPARVMAVADVYDALTSKRVYKEKFDRNLAVNILKNGKNTQFDGEILDAFLEYLEENPSV